MQDSGPLSRGSYLDPRGEIPDNIQVVSKILLVYEEYTEMMNVQSALIRGGFDVLGISTEYTLNENILSFNPDIVVALGRGGKVTTLGVGRRLREMTRWQGKAVLILPHGYKPNPQDFGKVRADMLLEAPVSLLRLVQVLAKMLGLDESLVLERLNKQNSSEATPGKQPDPAILNSKTTPSEDSVIVTGGGPSDPDNRWTFDLGTKAIEKEQDLESFWRELTEPKEVRVTPTPAQASSAQESKPVTFDLKERESSLNEHELEAVAKGLEESRKTESERVSKYAQFTNKIPEFDIRRSLSKVSARKVQLDISSSWNHSEIESQDKARQEFAKALFRKK